MREVSSLSGALRPFDERPRPEIRDEAFPVREAASLNEGFMPAVSVGDAVCRIAGALPGAVVASVDRELRRRVLPALAGGLAAFIANLIIL
jgi:hypothetical protein